VAEDDVIDDYHDHDDAVSSNQMSAFVRAPARKSLGNNAALIDWLDAQERLQDRLDNNNDNNEVCRPVITPVKPIQVSLSRADHDQHHHLHSTSSHELIHK